MLIPKKTKYRYNHAWKYEGLTKGNKEVKWGEFGLQAQQGNYIYNHQIEAARKVISKFLKKSKVGQMKANIFPHLGVTGKSLERMGSGYGAIKHWVAVAKKLRVVFELRGLPKKIAYQALIAASYKLPGQYKVVEKDSGEISE